MINDYNDKETFKVRFNLICNVRSFNLKFRSIIFKLCPDEVHAIDFV